MIHDRRQLLTLIGAACLAAPAAACGGGAARSSYPASNTVVPTSYGPDVAFAPWTDAAPEYLLFPGDEIEVATPTAAELTRTARLGPDGRITLPLIGQVMAADRTLPQLQQQVSAAYATQLVRPVVEVTLRQAGPIRVWVDGEVRTPGVYEIAGETDAYQAIIQAGGFAPTSRPQQVALIRRGPGGVAMMRVVDLRPRYGESVPMRRGDILFVPRSTLGELAAFFTQVKAALPIGFSYSINGANGTGYAQF